VAVWVFAAEFGQWLWSLVVNLHVLSSRTPT